MDIDVPEEKQTPGSIGQQATETDPGNTPQPSEQQTPISKKPEELDMDTLYQLFWGLQAHFSAPTRLFNAENFATFKFGIEATLANFGKVSADLQERGMSKGTEDPRRGLKRKRNGDPSDVTNNFNPKYLTSRDLFELEVIRNPECFWLPPVLTSWQ